MKCRSFFACTTLFIFFSTSVIAQQPQVKKNARPTKDSQATDTKKNPIIEKGDTVFSYEFEKPEFLVSEVFIEHDENGTGDVKFRKKDFDEDIVEPLSISKNTLERLKELWESVNFLESTEKFQSDIRDYGHLGTMKLRMKKADKERTEVFNWTENTDVKALYEEYRKIGNFAVWKFDFEVAKENQPLRTPRMMTGLDSFLRRNVISDPLHIVPFLKQISDDESVPLIARNHASRLAKRIEKEAEKEKNKEPKREEEKETEN